MADVTIRRVPDEALKALEGRAAQAGKSLQSYLLTLITREATRPTLAEVTARAEAEASASLSVDDVLGAIDEGRAGR
ncbi:FitA-like ribbon-helix-helix domain-containing protein [Thermoactinospora rubra]|uniref:FitA-like ribbon-helix-helix domain-containing protein n=1 Tax=Thermoactinospora rubra TaxID=1088767 RepID=UPI000A11EB83|nr:antitoxin [Thermoactinospora rubra]